MKNRLFSAKTLSQCYTLLVAIASEIHGGYMLEISKVINLLLLATPHPTPINRIRRVA
jgi:hypothetical protein